jgi:deazaflavin-dependent oxidoreductase (nitroreductase family)
MSLSKPPSGTRGTRTPPRILARLVTPIMTRIHRLSHDRFGGMDLLYLTTVGARSGQRRTAPVARFDDGAGGWFVVASAAGAATHPGWYHNIAAHPDQVDVEVGRRRHHVRVEQLEGDERAAAWQQIVQRAPGFAGYESKTDRTMPVLRLTPATSG